ncbi:NUDIX hydrolase [Candidatus Woesearchaeota archaeon]|nr:NUDIX hydrolase [Candidatus Woesearchaeota archaeon]
MVALEYCADVIALYQDKIVCIERLNYPSGYALPGGRREYLSGLSGLKLKLESVEECALREFRKETGLELVITGELGIYDSPDRDPRGPKISTAVYGSASGSIKDEAGKTRVMLLGLDEIKIEKNKFVFDHYQIMQDYMRLTSTNKS